MQTNARALTEGPITPTLLRFALPMMLGNLLQQLYNIADTLIVGRYVGADALAAVGSAYTLMTFLTSILLGLSMGSGVAVSISFGRGDTTRMRREIFLSLCMIGGTAVVLNIAVFLLIDPILWLLQVPAEVRDLMRTYLLVIFAGIGGTFLYNYYACLLRAVGDSVRPLVFLGFSAVLNIVLDVAFVLGLNGGVAGAAWATIIAQWLSGLGLCVYALATRRDLRLTRADARWDGPCAAHVFRLSFITGAQQSIMNFGILMVQGRVNSFGPAVMAAFAAAVKIDSFAYMPVQDFGNAFSTFIAQNFGAGQYDRIRRGTRSAIAVSMLFGAAVSAVVFVFAQPLMLIFVRPEETEILGVGVQYLRTEGAFYCLIALLFCSTASTAPSNAPVCRWCSPSSRWGCGWCWPMRSPPSRPWVPRASGCPSPSAGSSPMLRAACPWESSSAPCRGKRRKRLPRCGILAYKHSTPRDA